MNNQSGAQDLFRDMDRPRTYVDRMGVERHWDGRRVVK